MIDSRSELGVGELFTKPQASFYGKSREECLYFGGVDNWTHWISLSVVSSTAKADISLVFVMISEIRSLAEVYFN